MATPPTDMNAVLNLPMDKNDADATTIRDYLGKLLELVWRDVEGFDGKRPFGNSGWPRELYQPLVKAGFIDGAISQDGYSGEVDYEAADELIRQAITSMRQPDVAPGAEFYIDQMNQMRADLARARDLLAKHVL